jgi:ATP-dependent helicase/nuclease subunit A
MTVATDSSPRPVSAAQFPTAPRLLIRASAGTGKTFQLSNRYLSLLRRCLPDRILAVTFTRKAAGEILDRILTRLSDAVLHEGERERLSGFLGGPPLQEEECCGMLLTLVRQLHRVKVGTLDGFFSRLASSIPLEIGLPPNWKIADEHAARGLTFRAIDTVLRRKNEAVIRRLVHMLAQGDIPRSITRLMSNSVEKHFDVFRLSDASAWRRIGHPALLSADEIEATLIECEQLGLVGLGKMAGTREKDVDRFRRAQWEEFLDTGIAAKIHRGESKFARIDIPADAIAVYRRLITHVRGLLLKIWSDQIAATHELLTEYSGARRELQAESQELRFDDVAVALATRMSAVDARSLAHRLDADVDHLLLDEFQDTSLLQWDVLRPFVQGLDGKPGSSFFCVGDVKQAIYGWRGGVAALFDRVEREVPRLSSGMLNESRRSSPEVITVVNNVFQNLTKHPSLGDELGADVESWQEAFPEHSTALTSISGYVVLQTANTTAPDAASKQLACCGKAADVAAELLRESSGLSIGILTRKNEMVGRLIHELAQRHIQASEEGGVRLTTSAPVQVIQSLLQFADHPGDTAALFHVAHSPLSVLHGLEVHMRSEAAHGAASAIREELATRGYEAAVERWAKTLKPVCSDRDWSRLRRLCSLAAAYDPQAGLRPSEFARRIADERVEEATASAVRVMTIHKSKGLEFDVVILPDLDFKIHDTPDLHVGSPAPAERPDVVLIHRNATIASLLPPELCKAIEQQRRADVHESLCCLYVAMTRAAHALHMIIAPQSPIQNGSTTYQKTASGLLRAALATRPDLPPGETLFEFGDPQWLGERKRSAEPFLALRRPARSSIRLGQREGGRRRGRDSISPSHHKSSAHVKAASALSTVAAGGKHRGTLWHLWCQELKWVDEVEPNRQRLTEIGRSHCGEVAGQKEELDAFLSIVERDPVRGLFSRAACLSQCREPGPGISATCSTEWRFSVLDQERCLTGSIDRLVVYRRGDVVVAADVIDFKTDAGGTSSPLRDAYRNQLRQYGRAVAVSHQIEPASIRLSLVWLSGGIVENVAVHGAD